VAPLAGVVLQTPLVQLGEKFSEVGFHCVRHLGPFLLHEFDGTGAGASLLVTLRPADSSDRFKAKFDRFGPAFSALVAVGTTWDWVLP
jgi:hypothetical protein